MQSMVWWGRWLSVVALAIALAAPEAIAAKRSDYSHRARMPKRAAAESAATIAVGVARMNAHGQETTSTAMTRSKSRVNAQTSAPMTSTSGV